jgi:hypothetical protein
MSVSLQQKLNGGARNEDEDEERMQPWTLSTISLHSKSRQGTKRELQSSSSNSSIHDVAAPAESSNAATGWPQIPLPRVMPQRQGIARWTPGPGPQIVAGATDGARNAAAREKAR